MPQGSAALTVVPRGTLRLDRYTSDLRLESPKRYRQLTLRGCSTWNTTSLEAGRPRPAHDAVRRLIGKGARPRTLQECEIERFLQPAPAELRWPPIVCADLRHAPTPMDRHPSNRSNDIPLAIVEGADETIARLREESDQFGRLAMLGTLTAAVAHEVNNLLTPALCCAQITAEQEGMPEAATRALHRVADAIRSATEIAEAILGFARPDGPDGAFEPLPVTEILDRSIACLPVRPERIGVSIDRDIESDLLSPLRPVALQQVLMNLMLNAIAAFRGKPGRIAIRAHRIDDEHIRIVVSDNGPGLPVASLPALCQPFRRDGDGRETARRASQGGLGLGICRHLVESFGGTITLSSAPNVGTSFTIVL